MHELRIRVFGALVVGDDQSTEPELSISLRQLLAALVAAGRRGTTQDVLAHQIWGDSLPPTWDSSFRNSISRLRRQLGKPAVDIVSGRYMLGQSVSVDAWDLLEIEDSVGERPLEAVLQLLGGVPFVGVEVSPSIREMCDQVAATRRRLLEQLLESEMSLDADALKCLRTYWRAEPLDERVLELVVEAHIKADDAFGALSLLTEADELAHSHAIEMSSTMHQLRQKIVDSRAIVVKATSPDTPAPSVRLPDRLRAAMATPIIGRTTQVASVVTEMRRGRNALVIGKSGVGKTRLLAEVATQLGADGFDVLYTSGQQTVQGAFGPLVELLPGVAQELAGIARRHSDAALVQTLSCTAIADRTRSISGKPLCLIVDDAHLLDSLSESAIEFILRQSSPAAPVAMIISGRNDEPSEGFLAFRHMMSGLFVAETELHPLCAGDLAELARYAHPLAPAVRCAQLAEQVLELSGGLPGIALHVIRSAHSETLLLDHSTHSGAGPTGTLAAQVDLLSDRARLVGVCASVLGHTFELPEVVNLSHSSERAVLLACDELIHAGFVRELPAPDRFTFTHTLFHAAMLSFASEARRRRLHHEAADVVSETKRRAKHLAAATPLVPAEVAAVAVVEAAREHFDQGAWREAATAFREAHRLAAHVFQFDDRCTFAAALDLAGADGDRIRVDAVRSAVADGRLSDALRAATTGLPIAERHEGDAKRVEVLLLVPYDKLDATDRVTLAATLTRQLMFIGNHSAAAEWSGRAQDDVVTPDAVLINLINASLLGAVDPVTPITVPAEFELATDGVRLRALQVIALNHLERSDAHRAMALVERLAELTEASAIPHRMWHFEVLDSSRQFLEGDWEAAERMSEMAWERGIAAGINDAELARLAQLFMPAWISQRVGGLAHLLDRFRRCSDSVLSRVLAGLITAESGADDCQFPELEETVTEGILTSSSIYAVPMLCIVAPSASRLLSQGTIEEMELALIPRSGSSAIIGNGAIHAGPVDLALARLSENADQRSSRLTKAMDVADRQKVRLWQIVTRSELFDLTGQAELLRECEDLAGAGSLANLLRTSNEHNTAT